MTHEQANNIFVRHHDVTHEQANDIFVRHHDVTHEQTNNLSVRHSVVTHEQTIIRRNMSQTCLFPCLTDNPDQTPCPTLCQRCV